MIIRQISRQQGRALLRARGSQSRFWTRTYASETERIQPSSQGLNQIPQFSGQASQQSDAEASKLAREYYARIHQASTSGKLGASLSRHYQPDEIIARPPFPSDLTPELLLASQSHLGHSTSLWNPMDSRFIYGVRDGIHIIALEETLANLRRACRVVRGVTERGGLVLFVGTRKGQDQSVVQAAKFANGYHLFEKWIPGSITNGPQILGTCKKKIVDIHDKEIIVSEDSLRNLPPLKPDLVVCLNPLENWVLLNECALHNIPTVGIIDTDADPTWVTYPIPANDDSLRCTNIIAGVLGRAGQEGQQARKALAEKGEILYDPLQLPADAVLGEEYKTVIKTDGVPIEYLDENGQPMSDEQVAQMQREGMFVDDSLLTLYHDNDGGDPHAEVVHKIDRETGQTSPMLTSSGGGDGPGTSHLQLEVAQKQLADLDKVELDAGDNELRSHINALEKQMKTLEADFEQLVGEAGPGQGEMMKEELEAATEDLLDAEDAAAEQREQEEEGVIKQAADAAEELDDLAEKDRIEAAKPKPDDGRQARLDQEKKDKSH